MVRLKKTKNRNLDYDEFISIREISFKKLFKMVLDGKIVDSKTICAVLAYDAKKKLI